MFLKGSFPTRSVYLRIGFVSLSLAAFAFALPTARAQEFVADYSSNSISRVSADGTTVTPFVTTGLSGPIGLTFGYNGDLFASNYNNNTITRINPTTGATSLFATVSGACYYSGYRASTGDLFVAIFQSKTIAKIDYQGNVSVFASGLRSPKGIAIAPNGDVFLADNSGISRFNGSSGQLLSLTTLPYSPSCIALDAAGDLYTSNTSSDKILRVTTGPDPTVSTFAAGFSNPTGLAFAANGNLLVVGGSTQSISQVTPDGTVSTFASGLGGGSYGIAIAPADTPEPGSLPLLGAGLITGAGTILGKRDRRRKRQSAQSR